MARVAEPRARRGGRSLFAGGVIERPWALPFGVTVLCLVLGALSMLIVPGAPSYDPWAWIVWGREVVQGDLSTAGGPSWKPLPVLFTAPFSVFGGAAPDLWMLVARASLLGAVVAAAAVGHRLAGWAGAVSAAVLLAVSQWLWEPVFVGNSEALLILGVLAALDRHLAGRHGQAFAWGVVAALVRAEAWPFLIAYAAWLVVRDRQRLPWALGGLALVPALWFLPELWGSGSLSRGAERAQVPGPEAPALTARPAWTVVKRTVDLAPLVVFFGLLAGAAAVAARRVPRNRLTAAAGIAAFGVLWLAMVAVMTEFGFSGIDRYLLAPLALAHVLAGAGIGWAVNAVWARGATRRARMAVAAVAALALAGTADALRAFGSTLDFAERHQVVADDLDEAISTAGGERRVAGCGGLYSTYLMSPMVAWTFERHLDEVTGEVYRVGVALRAAAMSYPGVDPDPAPLAATPGGRVLARTTQWEIEAQCRAP